MKGEDFASLRINDLLNLENYKDNSRDNHLLHHIIRKVLEVRPQFKGFLEEVVESLEEMGKTDMVELEKCLKIMDVTCRHLFIQKAFRNAESAFKDETQA